MCTFFVRKNFISIFIFLSLVGCSQAFDVLSGDIKKDFIEIETKGDGSGDQIDNSYSVTAGENLELHAVYRDEDGDFVKNVEVSWRLIGGVGSLTILSNGTSASFTSSTSGSAVAEILYKNEVIKTVNINIDPAPVNDITVSSFTISNVSTTGFDVSLDFTGDDNDNSSAVVYYCNQTDSALCDPEGAGDSLSLTKGTTAFSGSVSGLVSPYDNGDIVYVMVVTSDTDGVTSIETTSKVKLQAPVNSITLNDFQTFNITGSGFDVNADFSGDSNDNATATLYYCDRTASSSCDPLTGESVSMDKYGTTFRASVSSMPTGYDAGDELNILVQLSDTDGASGSPMSSRVSLVSGLSDYPNANSLIGLWQLNDSPASDSTTIADLTGKHNGTLSTSDGATDKSDTGIVGQCISLDGSDDTIIIPAHTDFDIPTGSKMTFMGWYSRSGNLGADVASGISTGASNSSFAPVFDNNTTIGFWDGSATRFQTTVTNGVGEWHHYAVTYDGGNVVMYWDGVEVASGAANNVNETAFDFRIGGDNWGYYSHLKADEVSFWRRILTPQEINAIYNSQK